MKKYFIGVYKNFDINCTKPMNSIEEVIHFIEDFNFELIKIVETEF